MSMSAVYFLVWIVSLLLTGAIWTGLWLFKRPETNTNTRKRKATVTPVLSPELKEVDQTSSSLSRYWGYHGARSDREPFYMCMMWSLFVGGSIMFIGGPIHHSTIDAMDPSLQRVLAAVLCLGTGTCITGFTLGTRHFRPNADLRDCYRMAVIATPANVSTLVVYAVAVGNTAHWNLQLFGLGAGGILAIMIAHLVMAWDLHRAIRRIDERVSAALKAATNKVRRDQNSH
jgi:hypothetical protein